MQNAPYIKYRAPNERQLATPKGRLHSMRIRVLDWLMRESQPPSGYACQVPTRIHQEKADIAAFWSEPISCNGRSLLQPVRTCVIVCALDRAECWAAGVNNDQLLQQLRSYRARIPQLEEQIRQEEPELRDSHTLFEEYANWEYGRSRNPEYHTILRECHAIETMLFRGTRMGRILDAHVADFHYLAVPPGTLLIDEVMPGWGLLTVPPGWNEPVRVERPPETFPASPEARLHLVQNIAIAATSYVNAGHGMVYV